jgi:hypothetical protein
MDITLLFVIVAIVLFILAALGVGNERVNLVAAGLAFFAASFLPL